MSSYEESSTITQKEKEQAITVHDNKTWSTQGQPKLDYEETSKYSIIWANLEDPKSEYEVRKKIGAGSFGVIYDGRRIWDCKPVALKFEPCTSNFPQLNEEYRMYRKFAGCEGFATVYGIGKHGPNRFLAMDLLGPSLETLFQQSSRKFTVQTVVAVGKQMISRLDEVHKKGMVYRDAKPDNFVVADSRVFLIDLAMMKEYQHPTTKQHVTCEDNISTAGTARYMSINTHLGRTQSRRDDFESLWHVLIYFLRGGLPWQGMQADSSKKIAMILEWKQKIAIKDLCKGLPYELCELGNYVRGLGFDQNPDCNYMQNLLEQVSIDERKAENCIFERARELTTRNNLSPMYHYKSSRDTKVPTHEAHRRQNQPTRREVLSTLQMKPLTWIEDFKAMTQPRSLGDQGVIYNARQQETLDDIIQTAQHSIYRLGKLGVSQDGLRHTRTSRMTASEPISIKLESVFETAKGVSVDVLRRGSSNNFPLLKLLLEDIRSLTDEELDCPPCTEKKQVAIRRSSTNDSQMCQNIDEKSSRPSKKAVIGDEDNRARVRVLTSEDGGMSHKRQPEACQGLHTTQKHSLTPSSGQGPCKRRSQEKLSISTDI
ncbi:Palmitoylated plasma membrane-bound casein kinase [Fusarium poae]